MKTAFALHNLRREVNILLAEESLRLRVISFMENPSDAAEALVVEADKAHEKAMAAPYARPSLN